MAKTRPLSEELEFDQLCVEELDLFQRNKQVEEHQKRMQLERAERESTIPPLDDIGSRRERREHEIKAARGDVKNTLKEQNRSVLLLITLSAATVALIWWGWTLMQGY